jgi:hypothetical protein
VNQELLSGGAIAETAGLRALARPLAETAGLRTLARPLVEMAGLRALARPLVETAGLRALARPLVEMARRETVLGSARSVARSSPSRVTRDPHDPPNEVTRRHWTEEDDEADE